MARRIPRRRDAARPAQSRHHGLYDARWNKASKIFRANNPWCVACKARGETVLAEVVDHIEPHRGDVVKFWDSMNWQSLCKKCHDKKTAAGQ